MIIAEIMLRSSSIDSAYQENHLSDEILPTMDVFQVPVSLSGSNLAAAKTRLTAIL